MKRRLFLTGPIGCGKSTAIRRALGEHWGQCGGFLTRRYREPHLHFTVEHPDGTILGTFLDFSSGKPEADLSVFSRADLTGDILVLDEIGGIELLDPGFAAALDALLASGTPILGVLKGEGPANALIESLGLTAEYDHAAACLRQRLLQDPDTQVYSCCRYDETAVLLAREWADTYLKDRFYKKEHL